MYITLPHKKPYKNFLIKLFSSTLAFFTRDSKEKVGEVESTYMNIYV